jgi:hypothetical protein
MKLATARLAACAVLVAAGFAAQAQPAPAASAGSTPGPTMMHDGHGPMDGAMRERMREHMQQRRQERFQHRIESLKRILQLSPAQDGAWNSWVGAMRPAQRAQRPDREAFARMTTPQRIDAMRQTRAQRQAEMDRRADATKSFYAQLNPQQQKAFDEISLKFGHRMGRGGHGHHHGM